jgi:hypothetical protein
MLDVKEQSEGVMGEDLVYFGFKFCFNGGVILG